MHSAWAGRDCAAEDILQCLRLHKHRLHPPQPGSEVRACRLPMNFPPAAAALLLKNKYGTPEVGPEVGTPQNLQMCVMSRLLNCIADPRPCVSECSL